MVESVIERQVKVNVKFVKTKEEEEEEEGAINSKKVVKANQLNHTVFEECVFEGDDKVDEEEEEKQKLFLFFFFFSLCDVEKKRKCITRKRRDLSTCPILLFLYLVLQFFLVFVFHACVLSSIFIISSPSQRIKPL